MRTPTITFWSICVAVFWALPITVYAQQQRLATVHLQQVFESYWKTKQADAALKEKAGELDGDRQKMLEQRSKLKGEYDTALGKAGEKAVSVEERAKRKLASDAKLAELSELEASISQFDRQARTSLDEQKRRVRDNLVAEIRAVIETKAKSGGYSMVLDASAETPFATTLILYDNREADLTKAVIAQLNETAPVRRVTTGKVKEKANP